MNANTNMSEPNQCTQCGTALAPGALAGLCPACLLKQGAGGESTVEGAHEPFTPPPLNEVASLFPQLEVLELIGKGGMGAIYKARQRALDRFVALKLLPNQPSGRAGFAERFNREAKALARLSHPNIVTVYEFGEVNGLHYFLMEYVDGVNLRQLQRTGRLSPREALQIVPQICDALQYAHDQGVVHRDVKPENVLVDRKGRVKIADFGLARILDAEPDNLRLTLEGQVMGTPHYMAPEQVERPLEVDHRADIYALGVVFYEMLTGELPLGRFAPPSRKVQVDVRLDDVVLHALEKEPDRRYQTATQVKADVEHIQSSTSEAVLAGVSTKPPLLNQQRAQAGAASANQPGTPSRPLYRFRGARRALVAGGAAGLFVLLASIIVTLVLPEQFVSTTRVEVRKQAAETAEGQAFDPYFLQTEAEKIKSQRVLEAALQKLNLNEVWAKRYGAGKELSDAVMLQFLRKVLEVRQTRNTSLLEIRCYSEQPMEAARIANAVAESYVATKAKGTVAIIDLAEPGFRPVRPNIALNVFLGAIAGVMIGLTAGGLVFLAVRVRARGEGQHIQR